MAPAAVSSPRKKTGSVCLQGMFAEVLGCTMLASSIFLTYALIVVVRATHNSVTSAAQTPHAQPHAESAPGTTLRPPAG